MFVLSICVSMCVSLFLSPTHLLPIDWLRMTASQSYTHQNMNFLYYLYRIIEKKMKFEFKMKIFQFYGKLPSKYERFNWNSLNTSSSTSSKVLPFYFTLNFDRCVSFHQMLFLRFLNSLKHTKEWFIKKTLSPGLEIEKTIQNLMQNFESSSYSNQK